jgi:ATP-dependent RNA helicase DeaD
MTRFSELGLPPALSEAIAARGYEEAMPVQVAVLAEAHRDRDLLVSSQTGSGKTLAFGTLLARTLVPDPEAAGKGESVGDAPASVPKKAAAHKPASRLPSGLVIAPTRELANQVRTELAWLFARAKIHVAAFTGGSDLRQDLKKLHAGVDIVVGTPGRLCDLLSRGALKLEAIQTAVLDEADEMLDMGFHEDLETLLGAATARTRTHMFSATLPKPILSLAANYQKHAVRLDAHKLGESADGSHEDIRHVTHLIAIGDRTAAVINVLRQNADQRAIVFGTTRDGVADLHRELVRQGFRAVVLSGDRAQAERNRALSALREGEAQVLVATNVAARGLDLPEVDLVVHADLPLNTEALTHRSGRTGRAGRKGTSVLIANLAERRKAERLLAGARVTYTWTAAPGAAEIASEGEKRLEAALVAAAEEGREACESVLAVAARLGKHIKKDALIHLLLERELSRVPRGEKLKPVDLKVVARDAFRPTGPPPDREEFSRDAVRFRINLGADSRAEPGWLLPLICRRGGVTRREVGAIRVVSAGFSEFEIAGHAASDFALAAAQTDPRAPHVRVERVQGFAAAPPSAHAHRRPYADRSRPYPPRRFDAPKPPSRGPRPDDARPAETRFADARPVDGPSANTRRPDPSRRAPHPGDFRRPEPAHFAPRARDGHAPWQGKKNPGHKPFGKKPPFGKKYPG